MSLPLGITFEAQDHTYTILTKRIDRDTREIRIRLNAEELTISRAATGRWEIPERAIANERDLFREIVRNVTLRYGLL